MIQSNREIFIWYEDFIFFAKLINFHKRKDFLLVDLNLLTVGLDNQYEW